MSQASRAGIARIVAFQDAGLFGSFGLPQNTVPLKVAGGPRRLPGIRLVCISGPPDRRHGNHKSMAELEELT